MILIIDMDNVLNNMVYRMIDEFNRTFNTHFSLKDVKEYRFYSSFGIDLDVGHVFTKTMFNMPGFWSSLEPLPYAASVVKKLVKNYDVYVATKPYPGSRNCFAEKVDWLNRYFPFVGEEKLIFMHNKSLLKGDIIIDDHPDNLKDFKGTTIVFDYPFNRDYKATYRVHSWIEIEDIL